MATINDLVRARSLKLYEPPDWWTGGSPVRPLWYTEGFSEWVDTTEELHDTAAGEGGKTLGEHMDISLSEFRCAKVLHSSELRRTQPTRNGIWRILPPKLRLFGWCPWPHAFVLVAGALETQTHADPQLTDRKSAEVVDFIRENGLQNQMVLGDFTHAFPPPR